MSRNLTYILTLVVLTLTACSRSDSDEPAVSTSPVMMIDCGGSGIDMWQAVAGSRAAELTTPEQDTIHSVGIMAVNLRLDTPVFDNQQFIYRYSPLLAEAGLTDLLTTWPENNHWLYAPQKSWEPTAWYAFVGYSPYAPGDVRVVQGADNDLVELVWNNLSSVSAVDHLLSDCVGYQALGSSNPALPLSMKHLMARLRFCFKLGPEYFELRQIVVKEMKVTYAESRRMSLAVSYTREGDTYTPTYRWQRGDAGTGNTEVKLRNEKGVESITLAQGVDYQALASMYYEPGDQLNNLTIEVCYDVYDVSGSEWSLLRANDRAVSVINMSHTVEAGKYYDVKIQIEPTYLYVLSDNDTDADGEIVIQ